MTKEKEEVKYCPTQNGTFLGYGIEFRPEMGLDIHEVEYEWKPVLVKHNPVKGIPFPDMYGGILKTIWLFGHSQANALRYDLQAAAESHGKYFETRLVTYEIKYDIKARKLE